MEGRENCKEKRQGQERGKYTNCGHMLGKILGKRGGDRSGGNYLDSGGRRVKI